MWLSAGDWLVIVTTGHDVDLSSSSTSMTVAVRAYGTRSMSGLVVLASTEDGTHFCPDAVDEFKVDQQLVRRPSDGTAETHAGRDRVDRNDEAEYDRDGQTDRH